MTELQSASALPAEYFEHLERLSLTPLWPSLRSLLPYGKPQGKSVSSHWRYLDARPLLLQAGQLTPIEKAERRVLVLCNPGLAADSFQATPSTYIGLQLILPGEFAPSHRHTPSAVRLVIEGTGAYTTVEGQRLPMEPGDLILTPSGYWHEHGHEGTEPVIWMDALDVPLIHFLETSYVEESQPQKAGAAPDSSQTRYWRGGLLPYGDLGSQIQYPMLRYPWRDTRDALTRLSRGSGSSDLVWLAFVNPVTGAECLPTMGLSVLMLRPGEEAHLGLRSNSLVQHALEGTGTTETDEQTFDWEVHDIVAIPPFSTTRIINRSSSKPAFLFLVDDAPLQRKLHIHSVKPAPN
jgi:gentisate 1,2-dioxygenase